MRGRVTSTSIELKWFLGANGGAPVTSFLMRYEARSELHRERRHLLASTAWRAFSLPDALARSFVLTRLNCSTRYLVQLVALNDAGASEPDEISETTAGSRMPRLFARAPELTRELYTRAARTRIP